MDTRTVSDSEVQQHIAEIRTHMPDTYDMIQREAQARGRMVFGLVRAGLRGEPNRFFAMERGWVKGTPFSMPEIAADVAQGMVSYGSAHVCILGWPTQEGGGDGAH